MWEPFAAIVTAVKTAGPRIYAATLAGTALLLLLPDAFLARIGLAEIRQVYLMQLGILFIGSACLLATHGLFALAAPISEKLKERRFERYMLEALSELTDDEKEFLRPFIVAGENTRRAPYHDGTPNGLVSKGILYRATSLSVPGTLGVFPYNLQPLARRLLNEHPNLLE